MVMGILGLGSAHRTNSLSLFVLFRSRIASDEITVTVTVTVTMGACGCVILGFGATVSGVARGGNRTSHQLGHVCVLVKKIACQHVFHVHVC